MVCHVCFFLVFAALARWLVFPKFYTLIIFSGFRVPLGPLVRRLLGGKPDELFDSRISTRNKQKKKKKDKRNPLVTRKGSLKP